MKKTLVTLALILSFASQMFAMSMSNMRNNARFLSDRMAYELDLTPMQYDDCYEINFDFIYAVNDLMDDVVYGYGDAIERYYSLLDYRNEDLRFVLNARQYARFLSLEYFYRPIYTTGRNWAFRIHSIYTNHSFFYFDVPSVFYSYRGAHSHMHYHNDFYVHRHHHPEIHRAPAHIHGTPHMHEHGRRDFGEVRRERPMHGARPQGGPRPQQGNGLRPQNGNHNRPEGNSHNRPQGNVRPQGGNHNRPEGGARPQGGNNRPQNSGARPQNGNSRREHSGAGPGTRSGNNGGSRHENAHSNHQGGGRGGRR